jgi:hypothetical protein
VHPLGGCVMAEGAEEGVVDHRGRVFSSSSGPGVYDNLMVTDGSVVPCRSASTRSLRSRPSPSGPWPCSASSETGVRNRWRWRPRHPARLPEPRCRDFGSPSACPVGGRRMTCPTTGSSNSFWPTRSRVAATPTGSCRSCSRWSAPTSTQSPGTSIPRWRWRGRSRRRGCPLTR